MTRRQLRRKKRTPQRVLAGLLARYDWNLLFANWPRGYRIIDRGRLIGLGATAHEAIRSTFSVPPEGQQ